MFFAAKLLSFLKKKKNIVELECLAFSWIDSDAVRWVQNSNARSEMSLEKYIILSTRNSCREFVEFNYFIWKYCYAPVNMTSARGKVLKPTSN